MNSAGAKEYVFHFITALKLTEKKRAALEAEKEKWRRREELARDRGEEDLAAGARGDAERVEAEIDSLSAEEAELKSQIETMRRQLPLLAARERNVDPDLLEQELNIALGRDLAEDKPPRPGLERKFEGMDADAALDALKARMGLAGAAGGGSVNGGPEA
jgi:phage shock protein A